ncbi:unnamed protein product, partial [Urochloa humidicola]
GSQTRRDGGAGRDRTTRCWRPRGDEAAARAGRVAARHIPDSDGDRLPSDVHDLRCLLAGAVGFYSYGWP